MAVVATVVRYNSFVVGVGNSPLCSPGELRHIIMKSGYVYEGCNVLNVILDKRSRGKIPLYIACALCKIKIQSEAFDVMHRVEEFRLELSC